MKPNTSRNISFVCFLVWGGTFITGLFLPLIYTNFAFQVQAYLIFPLLMGGCFLIGFVHRKKQERAGYAQSMIGLPTLASKVFGAFSVMVALIGVSAVFTWATVPYSAVAANIFATDQFSRSFRIIKMKARSGTQINFKLEDTVSGEKVSLLLTYPRHKGFYWSIGDTMCVTGRTSIFGAIVDEQHRSGSNGKC